MKTTRRTFLGGAAVASLPLAVVALPTPETLLQRRDRLVSELVEVSQELTGMNWNMKVVDRVGMVYLWSDDKPSETGRASA